jgi:uracil DNA glycosylase
MNYPNFFNLCPDWTTIFYSNEMEDILEDVSNTSQENVYPDKDCVFRCFEMTPFQSISVVFIGNGPTETSTGLAYEVKRGCVLTKQIQRIYRDLENEGFYPTKDGNLEHWAKQGVLLLNQSLTSHPDGEQLWSPFLKKIVSILMTKNNIIWVVHKDTPIRSWITNPTHLILQHEDCLFKKINQELYKRGMEKISW